MFAAVVLFACAGRSLYDEREQAYSFALQQEIHELAMENEHAETESSTFGDRSYIDSYNSQLDLARR